MVERFEPEMDRLFQALADPTRREIVRRLSRGPSSVGELADPFEMSLAAVSKHLGVLEGAGLVRRRKQGRRRVCELDPRRLADAWTWLDFHLRFWSDRLDALDQHLAAKKED